MIYFNQSCFFSVAYRKLPTLVSGPLTFLLSCLTTFLDVFVELIEEEGLEELLLHAENDKAIKIESPTTKLFLPQFSSQVQR